jgi:sugar lactone lactonase YvrE
MALAFFAIFVPNSCSAEAIVSTIAGRPGQSGYNDGIGTSAAFNTPLAVAVDKGYVYVADTWNSTIRRIDIATHIVTTIAGRPGITGHNDGVGASATFNTPSGITSDGESLYIADTGNRSIRRIPIETGVVSTLTVGQRWDGQIKGPNSVSEQPFVPYGITTDGTNLYFTDPFFNTIGKIELATGALMTMAGQRGIRGHNDGTGSAATFSSPMGIATDGISLYIADGNNCAIRRLVLASGKVTTIAGRVGVIGSDDGSGLSALFQGPTGLALEADNLFIADSLNRTIRMLDLATLRVSTIAGHAGEVGYEDGPGSGALFEGLGGLAIRGNLLFAADSLGHTIRKIYLVDFAAP